MPSHGEPMAWLSHYLFFAGGLYEGAGDRVALDVAEPFVRRCMAEGWCDGHFFIRYSDRGYHIRLRLHGRADVLEGTVVPALWEHVRSLWPAVREGYPDPPEEGKPYVAEGEHGEVTHLARVEYEPETERYGGPDGVVLAEEFFQASSDAAYALLAKTHPTERSSRLGKGLLSMVVLVHVFREDREAAAQLANSYGINYLRSLVPDQERQSAFLGAFGTGYEAQAGTLTTYVDEVWSRLDEGEELSETLDRYHADLRRVRERFRALLDERRLLLRNETPIESWDVAVLAIVPSYIHMMNNRLGVSIHEEAYLAYLIHRALGTTTGAAAPTTEGS